MRILTAGGARVPWQCSSAKGYPKVSHKLSWSKGKQVNIPVHSKFAVTLRANF